MRNTLLIVLDGWGSSPQIEGNAIFNANTPFFNFLIRSYPSTNLNASSVEVGLNWGEMGNSEVGHLNLGSGRVVWQRLALINNAIADKTFFKNETLQKAAQYAQKTGKIHLIGLCSNGGVHSHIDHLWTLLEWAKNKKIKEVFIHVILDGRDTAPKIADKFLKEIEEKLKHYKNAKIASVCGRYFAMDRDKNWDRTQKAFDAIAKGKGTAISSALEGLASAYGKGQRDEFVEPMVVNVGNAPLATVSPEDTVIFFNFREDRARQLTSLFLKNMPTVHFITFTAYSPDLKTEVVFQQVSMKNVLAEVLSAQNLTQVHIAETEKYAHVTYFFDGGRQSPFPGEKYIVVPSCKVKTYDLKPEMSANDIKDQFLKYFQTNKPDFSLINFANGDMVGHTGNFKATIIAVETVDKCLAEIIPIVLKSQTTIIVTADHGNAEEMTRSHGTGEDTEHSTYPVPFIIIDGEKTFSDPGQSVKSDLAVKPAVGVLADVAPTILDIMEITKPVEMTSQSLKGLF